MEICSLYDLSKDTFPPPSPPRQAGKLFRQTAKANIELMFQSTSFYKSPIYGFARASSYLILSHLKNILSGRKSHSSPSLTHGYSYLFPSLPKGGRGVPGWSWSLSKLGHWRVMGSDPGKEDKTGSQFPPVLTEPCLTSSAITSDGGQSCEFGIQNIMLMWNIILGDGKRQRSPCVRCSIALRIHLLEP